MPKVDPSNHKEDFKIDADFLIQENLQYRRVQEILTAQLQLIETKVRGIKTETQILHKQFQKQKSNEDFLKRVIRSLSAFYGSSNIERAIEAADVRCSTRNLVIHESSSNVVEEILSQYMEPVTNTVIPLPKTDIRVSKGLQCTYKLQDPPIHHKEEEFHSSLPHFSNNLKDSLDRPDWTSEVSIPNNINKKMFSNPPISAFERRYMSRQQELIQKIFEDPSSKIGSSIDQVNLSGILKLIIENN